MLKHLVKVFAPAMLATALLSSIVSAPAQASAARRDGGLVHTVQFYPYGGFYGRPFYGPRFYGPGFYGPGFYGRGFYGRGFYGPAFYGRGFYGPGFFGRGFYGYRGYGGFYGHGYR